MIISGHKLMLNDIKINEYPDRERYIAVNTVGGWWSHINSLDAMFFVVYAWF